MPSSALWLIALLAAPAASDPDPRAAARVILERGRYQTELPSAASRPSAAPAPDPMASTRSGRRDDGSAGSRGVSGPSIPLPPAMLVWTVFAGLVVAGLAWAVREAVKARRGADADVAAPPSPEPDRRAARPRLRIGPLTDVEELARQGRYGEAIHLLLLHLFAALQRRPATAPAPAHTGREVLARTTLASDAKAALAILVAAAENVHFGGRVAGREDYENCLGHYRRFVSVFERAS